MDINLTGVFLCIQEAFRRMKTQDPARGPDHQQRLDLGACAAAELGALHGDEARDDGADEIGVRSTAGNTTSRCGQIDIGNADTEMAARMATECHRRTARSRSSR